MLIKMWAKTMGISKFLDSEAHLYFQLHLHNYFKLYICPSLQRRRRPVTLSNFQFLQSIHKMSVIKVAWHVLRVKNIHSGSLSDP